MMRDYPAKKKRVDMTQVRTEEVLRRALSNPGHWINFRHFVVTMNQTDKLRDRVTGALDIMGIDYTTYADGVKVMKSLGEQTGSWLTFEGFEGEKMP